MEEFLLRYPFVARNIFNQLDNRNLDQCKETSRFLHDFIENDKLYWVRRLQVFNKNHIEFEKAWKSTIDKIPIENLKQLANAVEQFYGAFSDQREFQNSPLHVVSERGNLSLYK